MIPLEGFLVAKKPDYRLAALFGIREKAKKESEDVYAQRQRDLANEQKKLDEMKQKLKDMEQHRRDKKEEYSEQMRSGALNITKITNNDRHIERMKQEEQAYMVEIQRQAESVQEAELEVEKAKEIMLDKTKDFKALEKHKEKWLLEVKREAQIKEEEEVEDISQAQYFKRQKDEREG